jgi:LacI family gluconate utilization system Gnt-I transcriptional repressor
MKERLRGSPGKATLADVANRAGVSAMTVSRALSQPDKVAEMTRERIQSAVDFLGYLPNLAAGTLRSNQSRIVAGVVPTLGHSIFSDTVQGISDGLDQAGYQLLLGCSGYRPEKEEELVKAFLGRRADGLILTGTLHSLAVRTRLEGAGVPVIETWDISEGRLDMAVGFDNFKAGYEIARHLLDCGYRSLGYVATTKAHESCEKRARLRSRGFYKALQDAGLPPPTRASVPAPLNLEESGAIAADFVDSHPAVEAILCANEIIGAGALAELQRRARRVPEEIAVAGIGDANIAALVSPGLTTVHIHGYEIGWQAAEMMHARLRGQSPSSSYLDVGFEIVVRGSTRKLPD